MELRINNIEELILFLETQKLSFKSCSKVVERTLNVLVFSETKKDLINDLRKYSYEIENTENRRLFLGLDDPIKQEEAKIAGIRKKVTQNGIKEYSVQ